MNQKLLTYVYYGLSIVSLVVTVLSVKYVLGGYDRVAIYSGGKIHYTIAGLYLDPSDQMGASKVFEKIEEYRSKGKITGEITKVYLSEAKGSDGRFFVGIIFSANVAAIPNGYEVMDLKHNGYLATTLEMHALVRPSKNKVVELMEKYAIENATALEGTIIESKGEKGNLIYIALTKN